MAPRSQTVHPLPGSPVSVMVIPVMPGIFRAMAKTSPVFFIIPALHEPLFIRDIVAIVISEGITGVPVFLFEFRFADSIILRYCSLVIGIFPLFARRALIKLHCLSLHTSLETPLTQSADFLTNQIRSLLFCSRNSGSGGIISLPQRMSRTLVTGLHQ